MPEENRPGAPPEKREERIVAINTLLAGGRMLVRLCCCCTQTFFMAPEFLPAEDPLYYCDPCKQHRRRGDAQWN